MDGQKVLILRALADRLKSIHGTMKVIAHLPKEGECCLNKIFVNNCPQILLAGQIVFIDLVRLLQQTMFNLKEVTIIPCEDRDLTGWMWDFADDAHSLWLLFRQYSVRLNRSALIHI